MGKRGLQCDCRVNPKIGTLPIFGVSLLRRNVRILKNGKCPYFESDEVNQDDSASKGILERLCS
jgi:hypothetical protein